MSDQLTRRDVIRRGAAATGAATVGVAGFSGTAAATLDCPRTIGYWKNHDEWPRTEIKLHRSEERLSVDEAKDILSRPPRGDKALIMAKQLIAAQLNITGLNAADSPTCSDVISTIQGSGDAMEIAINWLDCSDGSCADGWDYVVDGEDHEPVRSWVVDTGFGNWDGEPLKDRLDAFNNGRLCDGCGDGGRGNGENEERNGGRDRGRGRGNEEKDGSSSRGDGGVGRDPGRGNSDREDDSDSGGGNRSSRGSDRSNGNSGRENGGGRGRGSDR